jgi:hypothetical protein
MSTRRSGASRAPEASAFYRDVQDAADEVGEFIEEHMKERPYVALAAAAAVGYALGLPRGALAVLTGLGSRLAMGWVQTLLEEAPSARASAGRRRSSRAANR